MFTEYNNTLEIIVGAILKYNLKYGAHTFLLFVLLMYALFYCLL